jgi:hypothetical protein
MSTDNHGCADINSIDASCVVSICISIIYIFLLILLYFYDNIGAGVEKVLTIGQSNLPQLSCSKLLNCVAVSINRKPDSLALCILLKGL